MMCRMPDNDVMLATSPLADVLDAAASMPGSMVAIVWLWSSVLILAVGGGMAAYGIEGYCSTG